MDNLVPDKIYHPIQGMNYDSNGISLAERECIDAVNVIISQHDVSGRGGSTLLGDGETQPTETILEYQKYVDPELGTVLLAFCATTVWQFISGAGWEEIASGLDAFVVSQWSLSNGIDDTLGATVVAAGSTYARPNEGQSGGSSRILLYFIRGADISTAGTMAVLVQSVTVPISVEETGLTAPASGIRLGGPIDAIADDPDYISMEAGSFVIGTAGTGVIARAGLAIFDVAGNDAYHLIPEDGSQVAYGATSYVYVDGTVWSVDFVTNFANGNEIYISYDYNASVEFFPTYVSFYHNSLIMANTYEETLYHTWRLRYTKQGDITSTFFSYYQDVAINDITPIIQMKVMETVSSSLVTDYLFVYKQNSLIRAQYNQNFNIDPNVPAPFLNFATADTEGLEATRTVVTAQGLQFYMGRNDIYMFNGTQRVSLTFNEQTGSSRIKELIFRNLDLLSLNKCFGIYDEINHKYMLFIKTLSNVNTYPTDCFVYDMELRTWVRYTYPETSAGINLDITPDGAIADLVGRIQDLGEGVQIDELGGNPSKLVLVAMTKQSYIYDSSSLDKIETNGINMYYDGSENAFKLLEPQLTLVNGKEWWKWFDPDTEAEQIISWDGANWHAYSGNVLEAIHLTDTNDRPPISGWEEWELLGTPNGITLRLVYTLYGTPYDSYFITRDFVGSSLHLEDRTSLVYVEGSRGEMELSYNGNYSRTLTDFKNQQTLPFSLTIKRVSYSPDVVASWVRLLVTLKQGASFRWLQVFSTPQEFTNN